QREDDDVRVDALRRHALAGRPECDGRPFLPQGRGQRASDLARSEDEDLHRPSAYFRPARAAILVIFRLRVEPLARRVFEDRLRDELAEPLEVASREARADLRARYRGQHRRRRAGVLDADTTEHDGRGELDDPIEAIPLRG